MNPNERLSAQQALNHPYFEGVEEEEVLRRMSGVPYMRNDSKMTEKDEVHSPQVTNTTANESKKTGSVAYQSTVFYELEREKTEHSNYHPHGDNIFKVQKLNIGKKKKEDNFMTSKGMINYNSSNVSNVSSNVSTASKSLGKSKAQPKMPSKESAPRHISLEKATKRETLTKTQTGFYILGGSIIP